VPGTVAPDAFQLQPAWKKLRGAAAGRDLMAARVESLLLDAEPARARLLMSAVNGAEVYCFLCKHHSEGLASTWRETSGSLPVSIEVPGSTDIGSAAELKGRFPISYADAFAAALAGKHDCALVTGDPEFRRVSRLKLDGIGLP
jgi:uncharacterized protein